ncbi:GTPase Era [Phormidium willei BDU 130791]|nr:GTPase Era [Phormidium willei BDU 130791]
MTGEPEKSDKMDPSTLLRVLMNPAEFSLIPTPPAGFKSGFVSIIGRPNVGKSTLMNTLVGQKVAITSPVAQTTRNRLQGILTTDEAQLIFIDTPGIHKPHHQLGTVLVQNAKRAISSGDMVLFLVDGSGVAGGGDRYIAELLHEVRVPVLIGINKVDCQSYDQAEVIDASYRELAGDRPWELVKFSALKGTRTPELLKTLVSHLEPGPYYYPPDLVTDRPERFIMGELIREQILLKTREEVPHSVAIAIEKVEETPKLTRVFATINVERDSQKGILIGKRGSMLKEIGSAAREQIQKLVSGQIYLELFVKVQPKWRQSRTRLTELGYHLED